MRRPTLGAVGLLVLVATLPFWLISTQFILSVATLTLIFMAATSAWNIISGFGGQTSFGHSIFFGIGAYAPALLFGTLHINTWLDLLLGGVCAGVVGYLIGILTFRVRGIYFALATFALTLIFEIFDTHYQSVTGGDVGLTLRLLGNAPVQLQFSNKLWYYYIGLALAALVVGIAYLVQRSRLGLMLCGVRDDEVAARASGVKALRVKLMALVISAFLTALAGALYFQVVGFIDPSSAFGENVAVEIAVYGIIGGAGTLWGPVLGAAILVPLQQILGSSLSSFPAGFNLVVYAVIILGILWLEPRGLLRLASAGLGRLRRSGGFGKEGNEAGVLQAGVGPQREFLLRNGRSGSRS